MKKTYIIPALNVVRMDIESNLMTTSIAVDDSIAGDEALVKDNDWDIWGDVEEEPVSNSIFGK